MRTALIRLSRLLTSPKLRNAVPHVVMLLFQMLFFDRKRGLHLLQVGNYFLDKTKLPEGSVVYSFGIADHIKFDEAAFDITKSPIHCFDPTPQSITFMKQLADDERFKFTAKGLNDQPGKFKLYQSEDPKKINSSLFDIHNSGKFVLVECDTVKSFMAANGHQKIDLLKLDVEGVAIRSLNKMLDDQIFPQQILAEFEIIQVAPLFPTLLAIHKLTRRLRRHGYNAYSIHPLRKATVEALFSR